MVTAGGGLLTLGGLSMWTEGDASLRSAGTLTFLGVPMTLDATVVRTGNQVGNEVGTQVGNQVGAETGNPVPVLPVLVVQ